MTKVKKLTLENYKVLKGQKEYDLNGASFLIIGPNNKGKTTIGRAVMDAISKNFPTRPVTDGEKEGFIEVELTDGRVIYAKLQDGKRPKVTMTTQEGYKIDATRSILDNLSGAGSSFDIDEFLKLAPKPRREMIEKLLGVDLTELNETEKQQMELAAEMRREIKNQSGKIDEDIDEKMAEKERSDVEKLSKELESTLKARSQYDSVESQRETSKTQKAENVKEIDRLKAEIKRLEGKVSEQDKFIDKCDKWLKDNEKPSEDAVVEIQKKINGAEEFNKSIDDAKKNIEEREKLVQMETKLKYLEDKIAEVRANKEAELSKNEMPAEGLELTPDGDLLIDGLPFESGQISTSRKIIAGIQLKAAQLGQVRFIHFDASALDKQSADEIIEWAENQELQICIERPEWDGDGEIKFEYYTKDEQ